MRLTRTLTLSLVLSMVGTLPLPTTTLRAQTVVLDSVFLAGYRWRNLGPDRGGRSIAVSGVRGRPNEAYFGAVGGGLWKTTDTGENWVPVTDYQITSASVGAVAVSETNPDLVRSVIAEGCDRARDMARETLEDVRQAMGLEYR